MTTPVRQAVVLAGGRGTRLGSLTDDTPKPLLPVGGRPFLDWVIDNLARQGVTDVILTIGYQAEAFEPWLEGRAGEPRVTTFVEDEPLDTGGALALLADQLDDTFFVLNGDTLFDVPLGMLAAQLRDSPDMRDSPHAQDSQDRRDPRPDAAIGLRSVSDTGRYGRVTLDGTVVASFDEKGAKGPGLINGGVYVFRRDVVIGREPPFSLERDVLPQLVAERRVAGLSCDGFFIDIGIPDSLAEAQRSVPAWWERVTATKPDMDPRPR